MPRSGRCNSSASATPSSVCSTIEVPVQTAALRKDFQKRGSAKTVRKLSRPTKRCPSGSRGFTWKKAMRTASTTGYTMNTSAAATKGRMKRTPMRLSASLQLPCIRAPGGCAPAHLLELLVAPLGRVRRLHVLDHDLLHRLGKD